MVSDEGIQNASTYDALALRSYGHQPGWVRKLGTIRTAGAARRVAPSRRRDRKESSGRD